MSKTLDATLKEVWAWREKVMLKLQGASAAERAEFWEKARQEAEGLLGRPLGKRRKAQRGGV